MAVAHAENRCQGQFIPNSRVRIFRTFVINLGPFKGHLHRSWEGERRVNINVALQTKRPFGTSTLRKNDNDDASRLWLEVRLSDSGPGIPLDDQSSLFTRFNDVQSGDGMRRSSFGGTGLGMLLHPVLALRYMLIFIC